MSDYVLITDEDSAFISDYAAVLRRALAGCSERAYVTSYHSSDQGLGGNTHRPSSGSADGDSLSQPV